MTFPIAWRCRRQTLWAFIAELVAVLVGLLVLNRLWAVYAPTFPMARVWPAITAPVDGPFYLDNARYGYAWVSRDPLSLWFHPLLSAVIALLPHWLGLNAWFWLIGLVSGVACLILVWRVLEVLGRCSAPAPPWLLLVLIAPGGLALATGNAEIPALCFASALLLAVLCWQSAWLAILFGLLAILTKPNALYMVPPLIVYAWQGYRAGQLWLTRLACLGAAAIVLGWLGWMGYVDWKTGHLGSYLAARDAFRQYVPGTPETFFGSLGTVFGPDGDTRDRIRFGTALLIPIVNLWLFAAVPLRDEQHRLPMLVANFTMLAIMLLQGNPNKVLVYTTTLPWFFPVHLLACIYLWRSIRAKLTVLTFCLASSYVSYCSLLALVYIFGTPQGWYY